MLRKPIRTIRKIKDIKPFETEKCDICGKILLELEELIEYDIAKTGISINIPGNSNAGLIWICTKDINSSCEEYLKLLIC